MNAGLAGGLLLVSALFRGWPMAVNLLPAAAIAMLGPDLGLPRVASLGGAQATSSHAEVFERDGELWLRDLNSTNGSFVNGAPITGEERLAAGDLVQFADAAFRVNRVESGAGVSSETVATSVCDEALSLVQFDRLMQTGSVVPHFQPIVAMSDLSVVGYEVLGRSRHYGLESPKDMFAAASQLNQEGELSELLRYAGTRDGETIAGNGRRGRDEGRT